MTVFTKQAIEKEFLKLLEDNQLNQISVSDITKACGINRNTFYYHFSSITDLVETLVKQLVDELIARYPTAETLDDCLTFAINFAHENKKSIRNIYYSTNRAIFERHLWELCDYAVSSYINTAHKDTNLDEKDEQVIKNFLKCECFGFTINWINEGMPSDVTDRIYRLKKLIEDNKLL